MPLSITLRTKIKSNEKIKFIKKPTIINISFEIPLL